MIDLIDLFYPGFVFIRLDIPGKPVYLPFDWFGGNGKKEELQNWSDSMGNACYVLFCAFLLWAHALIPTAPGPIHCTEILRNKTSCWISNSDAILEHLFFDIASNIVTLHTFLTYNHNKWSINGMTNSQAFKWYLTWWI